jgi:MFS family permease
VPVVSESRLITPDFARIWVATLGAFTTFGMVVLALPLYVKDELGYGSVGVGVAMGAASMTSIVFAIVSGRLGDRYGRRSLLLAGGAVMVVCYLGLVLQPGLAGVVAIRLVAGAAEATFVVGAYTIVMDIAPEGRRGEATSLVTLASYLGLTFGPLASDLVRGDGRYVAVWLVAAALVLTATLVVTTIRETKPETEDAMSESWLPPRGALRPGLLVLVGLLGFGGFAAFAAIYARDLGIGRPGLVFALFGGTISLVRFFGRRLPDALGARRTLELSFVCLAIGLATIGGWRSTTGLVLGTIVFGIGQAMTYPSAVLLAVEATSATERSAAVGSVGAAVDVALGLGALTLGGVAKFWGYGGAFLVAAAVALSGLAILRPMRTPARIPLEEPSP